MKYMAMFINGQFDWIIIVLTVVTFSPVGVTTGFKCPKSRIKKSMVFLILTNDMISAAIVALYPIRMMHYSAQR